MTTPGSPLFAPPAVFVQGGAFSARTRADVAAHRSSRAGRIVSITVKGESATAVFVLADGKHRRCDARGQKAAAIFRVRNGKIVSWVQIPVPKQQARWPRAGARVALAERR